jgi:glycosyltransferase involved in cell wall biosynthesis
MRPITLAAIVLTKNEERDLPACLESLRGAATEIYVIDSGSTDRTTTIAEEYGAMVLSHPFTSHASQFNWALENIPSEAEWILRIDADERIGEQQRQALQAALREAPDEVTGFEVARRTRFLGRDLRYGDTYPVWLLRIWRRGQGWCEDTLMDEHIVVRQGKVQRLPGDLIHDIPKNLTEWTGKHNWYASRECLDITSREAAALEGQAGTKRWLKQNLYLRLPLFYRAFFYWFYRYFLKLGFLDGTPGLIYHFLQGLWYRFLVDAKLYEGRAQSRKQAGKRVTSPKRVVSS